MAVDSETWIAEGRAMRARFEARRAELLRELADIETALADLPKAPPVERAPPGAGSVYPSGTGWRWRRLLDGVFTRSPTYATKAEASASLMAVCFEDQPMPPGRPRAAYSCGTCGAAGHTAKRHDAVVAARDAAPAADEEPDPAAQPPAAPAEDIPTLSPGRGELLDDQRGGVPDEPAAPPPSASAECFENNSCAENTPHWPSDEPAKQEVPLGAHDAGNETVEESPGAPLVHPQRRCKRCHQPGHRSDTCDVDLRDARIADVVASCVRLGLVPAPPPRVLPVKQEGSVCQKEQVARLAWDRSDPEQDLTDLDLGAPPLPEAPADDDGHEALLTCSACAKLGHTRRTCPGLTSVAPAVQAALADIIPIRRLTEGRGRTENAADMKRELAAAPTVYPADVERPRTRGDCAGGARPCPFISCRHHLLLDVRNGGQSIYLAHDTEDPADLPESCSLDIADRGGVTLDLVGVVTNVSRERARQMEVAGLESVRRRADQLPDLDEADRRSPMAMLADS